MSIEIIAICGGGALLAGWVGFVIWWEALSLSPMPRRYLSPQERYRAWRKHKAVA